MSSYLFLITIGPIQDFIAAARRTRDLWAGSQLLSDLSREAAHALRKRGATLIFPAQDELDQHDVVNRILAETTIAPAKLGPQVEQVIRDALKRHVETTFKLIPGLQQAGTLDQAHKQVAELLEIFWAGVKRTDNYQQDRTALEPALAARKNTRNFAQPSYQASVPKSSIDGLRESIIPEALFPARDESDQVKAAKADRLFRNFGAGAAERLSGVDLFKRHYQYKADDGDFPSTSHFAALPLLAREHIQTAAIPAALERYVNNLECIGIKPERLAKRFAEASLLGRYDASIIFEERLAEELKGDRAEVQAQLAVARGHLQDFFQATMNDRYRRPEPYYAILHADGDNMGKVIDHQASGGVAAHQRFSRDLDAFADGVRAIVEGVDYRGALVYAGGDDVLAFLPLDTVLVCADVLRQRFAATLAAYKGLRQESATLSVGIAICHQLEPLADALNLARAAEKQAKQLPKKNALAITLSKRSGIDSTIRGSWSGTFFTRLARFIELHRHDAFPDGAAYELRDLDERVGRVLPAEALQAEALRILKRKHGGRGAQAVRLEDLAMIKQALLDGMHDRRSDGRPVWGVNELADELIMSREFARAQGFITQKEAAL